MTKVEEPSELKMIRLLRQADVETDEIRLAEMIWLARLMTPEKEEKTLFSDYVPPITVELEETEDKKEEQSHWGPIEIITRTYRNEPAYEAYINTAADETGKIKVSRRRVTGVPPIDDKAAINRSLQPFNRRIIGFGPGYLDEEATVERAAESDLILPVVAPKMEKWFDAVVVWEDRPAMVVWRETVREFRHLLERHGAFRDARLWRLRFSDEGEPHMLSLSGANRSIDAIQERSGRRLIFLFSDGVSNVWRNGQMRKVIEKWGTSMSVVLVQVLNEEHWYRTGHGDPQTKVRTSVPGSPNRKLEPEIDKNVTIPVVMPYPRSLSRWAGMLMNGKGTAPGVVLKETSQLSASKSDSPLTVSERLAPLTDTARKLIQYLSAVPLQVPVMRLVQRATLPDSRIEHLAEVMLSGLIKRSDPSEDISNKEEDEIRFDFLNQEIRDQLCGELRYGELEYVLKCVSEYIGERIGRRYDLRTLIADSEGPLTVSEEELPFARIAARALAHHGIRPKSPTGGRIIESHSTGWVHLDPFSFETVSLDARGKIRKRQNLNSWLFKEKLTQEIDLEMVEIPGGKFLMGTSDEESPITRKEYERHRGSAKWVDREMPLHEVIVSPFYMAKFAVTQAQWRIVAGLPKINSDLDPDPANFKGDDNPVETVSWEDAQEFCARLSVKTGRVYRLPTEAEWEYACRAGTTTPFAFGETITPEFVNYDGNYPYGQAKKGEYRQKTVPVGSLGVANAFGLYDMHGNVWEWCQDWFSETYYAECHKQGAVTDPQGPEKGKSRVLRGGSWYLYGLNCRSASRNYLEPGSRNLNNGFRVVVSARTSS